MISRRWRMVMSVVGLWLPMSWIPVQPVRAAEQFSVFYPPLFEFSISVEALEIFAEEGRITGELGFYAQFFDQDEIAAARRVLNQRFAISHVALSQFAYSRIGDRLLRNLSRVLLNGDEEMRVRALRGALVVAATDPEGLSVLGFLRRIPFERVRLDLDLSIQAVNAASEVISETLTAIERVQELAMAQAGRDPVQQQQWVELSQRGTRAFEQTEIEYFHPERGQTVVADLYLPDLAQLQPSGQVPLIVISHGIASNRQTFGYLARHLASQGFGVGVIEHPGTNTTQLNQFLAGFDQLPGTEEWLHRPRDITYLLDALAADPELDSRLNLDQVGLIGQSMGGYTVLAAAGARIHRPTLTERCGAEGELSFNVSLLLQCRATNLQASDPDLDVRDPRIGAVLALNPIAGTLFGPEGLAQIEIPTFLIAGSDDFFAPPLTEQIQPFEWLATEQRYLLLVQRGTHFTYLGGGGQGVVAVPRLLVGPDPSLGFPQLQAVSTAFMGAYLQGIPEHKELLRGNGVMALNADPLRLWLITEGDITAE